MAKFDEAFRLTLQWETGGDMVNGGLVAHPDDPGGVTKWGISQRWHDVDVMNLTLDEARSIYYRNYWTPIRGAKIWSQVWANNLFDFYVMSGATAVSTLQRLYEIKADGVVGPVTLRHINSKRITIDDYKEARLAYYRTLRQWPTFGRGWTRRVRGL